MTWYDLVYKKDAICMQNSLNSIFSLDILVSCIQPQDECERKIHGWMWDVSGWMGWDRQRSHVDSL